MLFTVNPREPKFFPLTLQASATVFHAAGEDWTLAREGWDLTNYGLFTGNTSEAGAITENLFRSMERLGCRTLVIGECGHGFAAARWEGAQWLRRNPGFEIVSVPRGDGPVPPRGQDPGGSEPQRAAGHLARPLQPRPPRRRRRNRSGRSCTRRWRTSSR